MKEKDIKVDFDPQQMIIYAEKEDSSYGPVLTGSYISKNYLDDFRQKQAHLEEDLLKKLKAWEISPVYYYMMVEGLTVSDLASRAGICKRIVKKHLDASTFKKTSVKALKRYAEIFNIPVANFFQLIHTDNDSKWKAHFDKEEEGKFVIRQYKTNNPYVIETKLEERTSDSEGI